MAAWVLMKARDPTTLPLGNCRQAIESLGRIRAAGSRQCGIKRQDHSQDTEQDAFFYFRIGILGKIHIQQDGDHDQGTQFPIDAEDQVHAGTAAGNIAKGEEQAGKEQADSYESRRCLTIIVPDGMDDGHTGQHADPVGREHECDTHDEDGDEQPEHVVPVVRAQHGGRRNSARADDHAGQDDAGTDPLQ